MTTTHKAIKPGYLGYPGYTISKAAFVPKAIFALSLILFASLSFFSMPCACLAQESSLVPPPPVSAGDESMVPPEVVPLTPPPSPVGSDQLGANTTPGLTSPEQVERGGAGPEAALGGMQTAKQARQTAFNALMGDQQWSPQLNEELQAQADARAATAAAAQPGGTNNMVASNGQQTGDYSESQTLTGGVKYQQNYQDTQRSGFTNATSSSLGLMSGYANPSNISTVGASNGLGLPFFLLGATGLRW